MTSDTVPQAKSLYDQLLFDLQAFLFAANGRVRFSELTSSFPTIGREQLMEALAELEEKNIISMSIWHNGRLEEGSWVSEDLKPIS